MKTKKARPTKDEYYLGIAEAVSKRSTCLRRQYGAIIVKDDEIIATGYNGSPRGEVNCCDINKCRREGYAQWEGYELCCAVHAEMNAIISAARKDMLNGTLYLYGYDLTIDKEIANPVPCTICSKLITNAGLEVHKKCHY